MECVSKSLLPNDAVDGKSVDLHDPLWRVAPYGWFSDEDDTIQPERKNSRALTKRSDFAVSATKNWTTSLSPNLPSTRSIQPTGLFETLLTGRDREIQHQRTNLFQKIYSCTSGSADDLNYWLSLYVVETCNKKGEPYPPSTLYQLLTGLHRHALTINPHAFNFLDKNNRAFRKLHNVIDNHFKALRKEGVGSDSNHTEIITKEEENKLWVS